MEILNNILLWIHLGGLVVGMGSGMALGVISPAISKSKPEERDRLWGLYGLLSRNAHAGLGLLLVTGPILVFTKFGGFEGAGTWFWIKMALVVVLVISIMVGTRASKRLKSGDASAVPVAQRSGLINGVTGFLIILSAVFAFN